MDNKIDHMQFRERATEFWSSRNEFDSDRQARAWEVEQAIAEAKAKLDAEEIRDIWHEPTPGIFDK